MDYNQILAVCQKYESNGFFVSDIPGKKLQNACKYFPIPQPENVIALYDSTVFGSCKTGLAISTDGIYWKNDKLNQSRKNHLSWEEFSRAIVSKSGLSDITFGPGNVFNNSGGSMKRELIINLLKELQTLYKNQTQPPSPPPLAQWMIGINGQQKGPYDEQQIKNMITNKEIDPAKCYVWRKGMANWEIMNQCKDFAHVLENLAETPPDLPLELQVE